MVLLLKFLFILIYVLISVAYFTHAERKLLAVFQRRQGPNVVGVYGVLQPLADGLKLLIKEPVIPSNSSKIAFILAPVITFVISLISWVVVPFGPHSSVAELNLGLLYVMASSSLGVYGIIIAGWSSNSKFAFLGALRSAAQMVSYEISIGFIVCTLALCVGSFNLVEIVDFQNGSCWFVIPFFPLFLLFLVCGVAETNRHPFDLPEAEAELVAGYTVEYSAMKFALFSLGEYANILLMSALCTTLFLGGWSSPFTCLSLFGEMWFGLKICFFVIFFVALRAGLPRFRYDQLMELGWTVLLPMSISYFVFVFSACWALNMLPQ